MAGAKRQEDLESQSLEVKFDSHRQGSIKVLLAVDPVYLLTPDEAGWWEILPVEAESQRVRVLNGEHGVSKICSGYEMVLPQRVGLKVESQ